MTPDIEKVLADLQAPGVWAQIGDLQVDAVVALKWAQSKLAAAGDMADEVRRMSEGIRSGALIPGMLARAEKARAAFEAVVIEERKAAPVVKDAVAGPEVKEVPATVVYQSEPVVKPVRKKGRKHESEKV